MISHVGYDQAMSRAGRTILVVASGFAVTVLAAGPIEGSTPCSPLPVVEHAAATPASAPTDSALTIASVNIAGKAAISDALDALSRQRDIDILLLQEVGDRSMDGAEFTAQLANRLGYHAAYAPADRLDGPATQGLAILSRTKLDDVQLYALPYHQLRFRSRCRIALEATVATPSGPVRVVNVHLDTRINSEDRVAQLAPIFDRLDRLEIAQIIGGDFNTMPVHWFRSMWPLPWIRHQAEAVAERMNADGFHTPFNHHRATLKLIGLPIHLDWVYVKRLQAVDWCVKSVPLSDHRGIWIRVRSAAPDVR